MIELEQYKYFNSINSTMIELEQYSILTVLITPASSFKSQKRVSTEYISLLITNILTPIVGGQ